MHNWQVQEAKARFSEVLKEAERSGPQQITSHGRAVAVLLSRREYDRLTGTGESLLTFMQRSPLLGLEEFEVERDPSLTRELDL